MRIGRTSDLAPWPLFIGFYTPEYEEEAGELRKTLDAFGLPHEIEPVESTGSWWLNTQIKAQIILLKLRDHLGRPLVYLDCDARVRQAPTLFRSLHHQCDFAAHFRPDRRFECGRELLSGTLYFSGSPACQGLVQAWIDENERQAAIKSSNKLRLMDQRTLQTVLAKEIEEYGLMFTELPATYVQIFDIMRDAGDPVIEHLQASRRLRNKVGH